MKKMFLAYIVAITATVPTMAAETASVSLSIKQSIIEQCIQGNCTGFIKGNVSWNHAIDLTPQEESALQEDTSMTLLLEDVRIDVRLGDDPNFDTGDTSAKLTAVVDIDGLPAQANVQLKWGNGQLKIKLSLPFSGEETSLNKTLNAKEPNGFRVSVSTINGLTPVFDIEQLVTGDSKEAFSELVSAEGDVKFKSSFSFKSKALPLI
jgi:hypothetical protein